MRIAILGVSLTRGAAALALIASLAGPALADTDAEKALIAKCGKDLCAMIASKDAKGPDLSCDLTKTWEKDEIQKGADQKKLSWGLGSAKCTAKVSVKRAAVVAAFSSPENTFRLERQSVACEIGEDKYKVSARMAPELKFKDGATTAVSLNMTDIQGAALIKGVVWTAAALEKNFGILQGDMIREVNRFIKKECPRMLADLK
jgi:hypothetical protein